MRRKILPFILGGALSIAAIAPAAANSHQQVTQQGAAFGGLVGAVVQAAINAEEVVTVDINRSLNNLLRDADIDVELLEVEIEDSLNNILNNLNVEVTDVDIDVLSGDVTITLAPAA